MAWRWSAALFLLALASVQANDDLAPGKFLIAGRDLGDPNFAESVILLIDYDADHGAMGLIVNRRSDVPLSRLFRDFKEAKTRTDPVYVGGPVEVSTVLALLRSSVQPGDARHVFADVYLLNTKDQLQKALADRAEPGSFHVFVGYAGWGKGQLEHEVELGAWHILPAESALVFHSDPDTVWPRLIRRTEQQIARAGGNFYYPAVSLFPSTLRISQ
ncbi:MAG TPA: YqgE/AlgH family protein [Bryobacteraceae bacterium]|nr:YqgE/AlgH family protein [Bryobacteraceae bacterium]